MTNEDKTKERTTDVLIPHKKSNHSSILTLTEVGGRAGNGSLALTHDPVTHAESDP